MELIPTFRGSFCINLKLRLTHCSLNDENGYGTLGYPYAQHSAVQSIVNLIANPSSNHILIKSSLLLHDG